MKKLNLVIYGATGSIGDNVISIVKQYPDRFKLEGITCNKNILKLKKIAEEFKVKKIGFVNVSKNKLNESNIKKYNQVFSIDEFDKIISSKTDIIIFAISGLNAIYLISKLLKSGKTIGLANKECLISFGRNLLIQAEKFSTKIIPLDSEHNSIHHLLKLNNSGFKSITITASGGPFLNTPYNKLKNIKPKEAMKHPIWKMGKKISIDSATMMNKALEIIEAKYLFNLKNNQINAIVHPQSIVHAFINYQNGVSTAILYQPDMKVPISSLFFNFDEYNNPNKKNTLSNFNKLEFLPIDKNKYPAVNLAYQVLEVGGLAPNAFNYLNELLVTNFLNGRIKFTDIVELNEANLDLIFKKNKNILNPKLKDIIYLNNWIKKNLYLRTN